MAITMRSPRAKPVTPSPMVSIAPVNSWPMMMGGFILGFPLLKVLKSEPQTAQASTFTRSSPARHTGRGALW